MTSPESATILVVDDHPVLRHGLTALLAAESWVGRVLEASTIAEGLRTAVAERPSVAVIDLGLPDGSGIDLVARIRFAVPDCAVLVLTMDDDHRAVRASLEAGARGYLLKSVAPDAVVHAVRTVADGGLVLGPGIGVAVLGPHPTGWPPPLDRLSPQDLRVLALVADGTANPRIARILGVTEKTIRNRLSQILATLQATDRVQAALIARDHGLSGARLGDLAGPD